MCSFSTLILLVGSFWPVKTVARITYTVLEETLNPAQSISCYYWHASTWCIVFLDLAFTDTIDGVHQSLLVTAQYSEPYRKMCRMEVMYSFSLVETEILGFQIRLFRFCMVLRHEISGELWVDEWTKDPRQTNSSTIATSYPRTVIVDGMSSLLCCQKLGLLSSASSPRAREMRPLILSSQVHIKGVQVAWQVQRHHRQNPDLKITAGQMILHLCLCQQFFPATSAWPWWKSLMPTHTFGELQSQSWTKVSGWDANIQLTELLHRALINLTILSLISSNQSHDQLCESKAAHENWHKPHLCANKLGLIFDRMTLQTSFPSTKRNVIRL